MKKSFPKSGPGVGHLREHRVRVVVGRVDCERLAGVAPGAARVAGVQEPRREQVVQLLVARRRRKTLSSSPSKKLRRTVFPRKTTNYGSEVNCTRSPATAQ